jgi:hypothetical protein
VTNNARVPRRQSGIVQMWSRPDLLAKMRFWRCLRLLQWSRLCATVCRLAPQSHRGLVTSKTLRAKRKSLSLVFSVCSCARRTSNQYACGVDDAKNRAPVSALCKVQIPTSVSLWIHILGLRISVVIRIGVPMPQASP